MTGAEDARWMEQALELAARGLGNVWPNPAVGCVLVKDGVLVGMGWTQPKGRPHAETEALGQAGARANGATAYVTLEPCAHHGQTPPCADALIAAGIARCVVATGDPDERVAGAGLARLRAAGITVETGLCEAPARALNAGYFLNRQQGRPRLTLKLAISLDGRIALGSGASRWITGAEARREVHHHRATHDAILIGAGTARTDDPRLDVREGASTPRPPVRVVADPHLRLSQDARMLSDTKTQPVWLLHSAPPKPALATTGARLLQTAEGPNGLNLTAALKILGAEGLTRVYCEGGGTLAAGLIRENLVDELILMTAGKVIGADGQPAIGPLSLTDLNLAPRFTLTTHQQLGADLMTRWYPA